MAARGAFRRFRQSVLVRNNASFNRTRNFPMALVSRWNYHESDLVGAAAATLGIAGLVAIAHSSEGPVPCDEGISVADMQMKLREAVRGARELARVQLPQYSPPVIWVGKPSFQNPTLFCSFSIPKGVDLFYVTSKVAATLDREYPGAVLSAAQQQTSSTQGDSSSGDGRASGGNGESGSGSGSSGGNGNHSTLSFVFHDWQGSIRITGGGGGGGGGDTALAAATEATDSPAAAAAAAPSSFVLYREGREFTKSDLAVVTAAYRAALGSHCAVAAAAAAAATPQQGQGQQEHSSSAGTANAKAAAEAAVAAAVAAAEGRIGGAECSVDSQGQGKGQGQGQATAEAAAAAASALRELGALVYEPQTRAGAGIGSGGAEGAVAPTWHCLAAADDIQKQVEDSVLLPLMHPSVYHTVHALANGNSNSGSGSGSGSNRPRAVLFTGAPGTGKTTTARIIANSAGVTLVYLPVETVASKWYGESQKRLSQVFSACEQLGDSILFLDEVDSLATSRDVSSDGGGGMHEATRRLLSVLLRKLDGFDTASSRNLLIAATNRAQDLDAALLSRMDVTIHFPLPSQQARAHIFRSYARHLTEAELEQLAQPTLSHGMSGRDIKEVCHQSERSWAAHLLRTHPSLLASSLPAASSASSNSASASDAPAAAATPAAPGTAADGAAAAAADDDAAPAAAAGVLSPPPLSHYIASLQQRRRRAADADA